MFPAVPGTSKEKIQRQFAYNISRRCTKEFTLCYDDQSGDLSKIRRKLTYVTNVLIECYTSKAEHNLGMNCTDCIKMSTG